MMYSYCLHPGRRTKGLETAWMKRNIGAALLKDMEIDHCVIMTVVL